MKRIMCTSVILLSLAAPASAGFDEGMAAYKRGDYSTALREIRPLAERGDAKSQNSLALISPLTKSVLDGSRLV